MEIPYLINLKDNSSDSFLIKKSIQSALHSEFGLEIDANEIELGKTQDDKFGDLTTNIALKISKEIGKNPREIAEELKLQIINYKLQIIDKVEVAGPGFLNFYLSKNTFHQNLENILQSKEKYGKWQLGEGKKVMVEFGQPNTHKAFHVGHLKSAITGLGVVKLFETLGFKVIKANFYGDVGLHVAKCIWGFIEKSKDNSFSESILNEENPHSRMKLLDSCYVFGAKSFKENPDSEKVIREINKKIYSKEDPELNKIYEQTRDWSLQHLNSIFSDLGVVYDRQYPESEVYPLGVEKVKENIGKIFVEDKGAIILPGEKYGVSTWVFITNEGNPTYSAKDYGLATKKFEEYPDLVLSVYTTSVEQIAYFKGVFKALELTDEKYLGKLVHEPFGWMLREDKKKFSSRLGETIKGIDILNEAKELSLKKITDSKSYELDDADSISKAVSVAGLKFLILSHELHKDISYDPEEFLNPEGFSGPYVLYAYVRSKSILRQAGDINYEIRITNYELNSDELALLKILYQYPQVTLQAGKTLSPHLIAFYLFELAQSFNKFYKENKVLVDDENIKNFRLQLVEAVSIVLKNGLNLLGIDTVEQM